MTYRSIFLKIFQNYGKRKRFQMQSFVFQRVQVLKSHAKSIAPEDSQASA